MTEGADQPPEPPTPVGRPGDETGNVSSGPFFQRTDWLSLGLTSVVLLVVYSRTLAPEVTLEYSGLLSTSAKYAGVPHPPGFPVWTLRSVGLLGAFLLAGIAAVVVVVRTRRFGSEWKPASRCGLLFLLGLAWCFYLPVASMTNPPVNWGYARTVEGFFHAITRGQYERYRPTDELGRFLGQLWTLAKETGRGFGWPYLVFTALPFGLWRQTGGCARAWLLGLTAAFVCVGPLLVAMLNPSADRASVESVTPFFAAMYVILALWTGLGLMVAGSAVAKPRMQPQPDAMPRS